MIQNYSKFMLNEYAPELMFKEMISFVSENKQNPFFLYWATPIPHNALQAPQNWIDFYKEKFGKKNLTWDKMDIFLIKTLEQHMLP